MIYSAPVQVRVRVRVRVQVQEHVAGAAADAAADAEVLGAAGVLGTWLPAQVQALREHPAQAG